jgi:GntR family transcriptional repressor for pyruvate dehydrogenase complex
LCGDIVAGTLPAGSLIESEPELVSTYGVSKTVVRETIQALAALGVVRVQHGKRSVVLPESDWNILTPELQEAFRAARRAYPLVQELYDVRMILEPQAARWTAERRSSDHCDELQRLVERMRELLDAEHGAVEFLDRDREFHLVIATASANRVLRAVVRDVHELLLTSWLLSDLTGDDLRAIYEQHSDIARAIYDRDSSLAETTMREHLEWAAAKDRTAEREREGRLAHAGARAAG